MATKVQPARPTSSFTFLLVGIGAWAGATIGLRVLPGAYWPVSGGAGVPALFLLVGGLVIASVVLIQRIPRPDRFRGALLIIIPGMTADAGVTQWFALVFPHVNPQLAAPFGAAMLSGYAVMLLVTVLFAER